MSAVATELITADELFAMPGTDKHCELVKGELRRMSPTGGEHGILTIRFSSALNNYVEENDLGIVFSAETGFKLASNPDTVRAPDVAFTRAARIPPGAFSQKFWTVAPDLAVEVLSPGNTRDEMTEEIADYLSAGVAMVVVVSPRNKTVEVHRAGKEIVTLRDADTLDGADVIPGFKLNLTRLFALNRYC